MNILILDDEMLARQELTFLIQQSKELDHPDIFEAEDISSAEKILFRQQIDLIFLTQRGKWFYLGQPIRAIGTSSTCRLCDSL